MDESSKIKDANDLLQAWVQMGMEHDEQVLRAQELLAKSPMMVERAADWAGQLKGADYDAGVRVVFAMVTSMDKVTRAQYRTKIAKSLNITVREFNDILRAATTGDKKDGALETVETLGGYIDGWLVEYLYEPEKHSARLAYRSPEGKIGTADELEIEGRKYVARYPSDFIRKGGILFPSDIGQSKAPMELVGIVEAFIHEHYLLEDAKQGRLMAYYVLMTWLYDCFNAIPYLRAIGEAGAGKSELMKRVGHLCYRLIIATGASTAPSLFRTVEMFRGTVFMDEADLQEGGDMTNDIVKFINLGAMKGNPITRLNSVRDAAGNTYYEIETYETFCPKLFAMRRDFKDDAVGSRSITFKLMPREALELKMAGVKLYVDEEFRTRARWLRNLLLRWRLERWQPEIEVGEDLIDVEISSRLNQVTGPLKAMAVAAGDMEMKADIERFLRAYNSEMVLTRSMTIAARVVEAMWKIYRYQDLRSKMMSRNDEGRELMMIGDVRLIANEIMDEMNRGGDESEESEEQKKRRKKDELSARGVGHIVRNELQLQVGVRRGTGFPVYWDEIKMQALAKRYGVDWESIPAGNGKPGKDEETIRQKMLNL